MSREFGVVYVRVMLLFLLLGSVDGVSVLRVAV